MRKLLNALLAIAVCALTSPASAQEGLRVFGYGEGSYKRTNGNMYLGGGEQGDYSQFHFNLGISSQPTSRLRVTALASWLEVEHGTVVDLDYAFAEYTLSDLAKLRAGRIRVPFGSYAEALQVGTIRPFFRLPQGIYGPSAVVTDFYQGAGITGTYYSPSGWGLQYDVFGGLMEIEGEGGNVWAILGEELEAESGEVELERIQDLVGGHVNISAPVDGLAFGAGVFTGAVAEENSRTTAFIGSAEYISEPIYLRTEYAQSTEERDATIRGFYGEAAVRLSDLWQVGVQYDRAKVEILDDDLDLTGLSNLMLHESVGFTLNYWFNRSFVFKASYSLINGNLFAGPEEDELEEAVEEGELVKRTNVFTFGTQFSF